VRRLLPATSRDRGATIPIVALLLPVLILMVAFAVDLGMQRSNRRTMQARADIIALDLARLADGRTEAEIYADPSFTLALNGSADRNDVPVSALVWDYGTWTVGSPFNPAGDPPNAVQVTATQEQDYFFQPGSGTVTRTAVAAYGEPIVDLVVGSVAAGFQLNGPGASASVGVTVEALNRRLARQFGATIPNPSAGFDLVGYQGLANSNVDMGKVAANAGFGSPNEMLDSTITAGEFFDATASALDQQAAEGDPNAANAAAELRRFRTQMGVDSAGQMRLGDTIGFEQGGDDNAANTQVNALDLMTGAAEVINGKRFITYQLSTGIPGLLVADVEQYLVRPATRRPDLSVGESATNKQMRFKVVLSAAPLLGMTQRLRIPLVIEAAVARGTVNDLTCADPLAGSEATIGVETSGVTVRLGTTADLQAETLVTSDDVFIPGGGFTLAALQNLGLTLSQILSLNLASATTASGSASVLGGSTELVFEPFVDPNPYQRAYGGVGAGTIGAQLSSSFSATLGTSLLSTTALNNITSQLGYVFNNLEQSVIGPLLAASGITIAGADVLAHDLECEGAGLKLVD